MRDFNEYQEAAIAFAKYPIENDMDIIYPALGLVSEAGEVADKLKKHIRDGKGIGSLSLEHRREIMKELGDVLWYTAVLCWELDFNLSDAAETNIMKLESRKERNVIGGSGDNR